MAGPDQASPHLRAETLTLNNGGSTGALTVTGGAVFDTATIGTLTQTNPAIVGPAPLIEVFTTTQVLTAAHNGAYCAFSVATVTTYTLPAAQEGLFFRFGVEATAAGTLDIFRIVCATGDFFIGTLMQGSDTTYMPVARDANGSTHLAIEMNGTTTGGFKGDWIDVYASNGTLWRVRGQINGSGTEATPFKTS